MFVLIATFCSGLSCFEAQWPVQPITALPHNCLSAVNELAPEWLAKHPGYTLRRAKCVPEERIERDV